MPKTSTSQDAIRLLFIFVHGADIGCFEGKAKLHAMDFWVRYPDYLAYELLNRFDETRIETYLENAKKIVHDKEPDLRSIPMIRYKYGAFDDIDEALAILISTGLIVQGGEKNNGKIINYDYYITPLAKQVVESSTDEFAILSWYDERSKLVRQIAGNQGGSALKDVQYRHMTYASTGLGTNIPSIKNEVEKRLQTIVKSYEEK
jgi:hypothetical protein